MISADKDQPKRQSHHIKGGIMTLDLELLERKKMHFHEPATHLAMLEGATASTLISTTECPIRDDTNGRCGACQYLLWFAGEGGTQTRGRTFQASCLLIHEADILNQLHKEI
jgi:hypothetical protein